jgi:hypothetical protein
MPRTRLAAGILAVVFALAASTAVLIVSPAFASGGGGSSGGSGGGGGTSCAPLALGVSVAHADGNGNSSIQVQATVRDCTALPQQHLQLTVSVPGSGTVPASRDLALQPGGSLRLFASPIGSTPLLLHFGETYNVIGTLVESDSTPTTLATISIPVTMPAGVVS